MSESAIAPRIEAPAARARLLARLPLVLTPALALLGLVAVRDPSAWLTLTVAGLAMGLMIFIMASGLTLVFGLMDVINFGHGAFVAAGAFVGFTVLRALGGWTESPALGWNLAALGLAVAVVLAVTGALGWVFERLIVRPVYRSHLKQILVTMGGLIVAQQLIVVFWGPQAFHLARPAAMRGSLLIGDAAIEIYRLVAVAVGIALFVAMRLILGRTKIGLIVRAGVENGEMVEALGYRVRRVFVGVFIAGSALAGLGGVMWGLYQESITSHLGSEILILVFIVVIIGGLGSVEGCFVGALLVGLLANYVGFLAPKLALVSNIALMVAVLMWRPQGLYPVVKAK
ncbi:MAG: branched-chain amino acid ABC transporter permease [Variibacter sp.]|nr:branched-chain amino acid ABC transporter permease [Variibacter sp.]